LGVFPRGREPGKSRKPPRSRRRDSFSLAASWSAEKIAIGELSYRRIDVWNSKLNALREKGSGKNRAEQRSERVTLEQNSRVASRAIAELQNKARRACTMHCGRCKACDRVDRTPIFVHRSCVFRLHTCVCVRVCVPVRESRVATPKTSRLSPPCD